MSWVGYIFLVIVMVFAHKAFKEGGDSFMSYGQGLGIGTLVSLITGLLSSAFMFIYVKFVDDSMIAQIKEQQISGMEEQGLSDAQIESAMEIASRFLTPGVMAIMGVVFFVFIGFIISLIVSAITKKNNPSLEI